MLHRHAAHILSTLKTRMTNAISESIKLLKTEQVALLTLEVFTDSIYLTIEDVDIPAQISK